jgi:hypothetical protein
MKQTIVPAQVTTVEDRIAGNLSMSQLALLIAPLFVDSLFYMVLPRPMHFSFYKAVLMALSAVLCCLAAIRVRGKILLLWAVTVARYNVRPKYYLYNKNSLAGREQYEHLTQEIEAATQDTPFEKIARLPRLALADKAKIEALLLNPAAKVSYEMTKGRLHVRFTEVQD